jgi:hypothetical protein
MARRIALLFLALASPLVLLSFLLPGSFSEALFAVLVMGYPVALIALAVARQGRIGVLGAPLLCFLVLLEGCVVAMLLLRGRVVDGPWVGGLPLAAAVQLYGLWLAPLFLVALIYALSFDRYELREKDLERLRSLHPNNENDD